MALSIDEGTKKEIMDLFTMPGGFKAGYVKITGVEVQYPNSMVMLMIAKYASEEARQDNHDNCVPEGIGFPVTAEAMESIKVTDDRDVFYPYLEAQIQYLALEKDRPKRQDYEEEALYTAAGQVYTDKVQAIYDELSLENPYK